MKRKIEYMFYLIFPCLLFHFNTSKLKTCRKCRQEYVRGLFMYKEKPRCPEWWNEITPKRGKNCICHEYVR
jgi:hypothetical protein